MKAAREKKWLPVPCTKPAPRKSGPFLALNCGAIPENLIESTLFGHERGAFTGAERNVKGYFRDADGGTLLLDEIGELPLGMQSKLLRVLEDSMVTPVGTTTPQKIDVRIVGGDESRFGRRSPRRRVPPGSLFPAQRGEDRPSRPCAAARRICRC